MTLRRLATVLGLVCCGLPALAAKPLEFVALGDMPYGPTITAGPAYRHLIGQINALGLPFAIHVGDFKDGTSDCGDAVYAQAQDYFQGFDTALIYTPGDNDWLDCQRRGDNPLERLQALRKRFFAKPQSQGRKPLAVQRQADVMPAFARYTENLRWQHQGVVFATYHTVGFNNGMETDNPVVRAEALAREAANAAWITACFALARQHGARAMVLATQADALVYPYPERRGRAAVRPEFDLALGQTLLPLAEAAPFPVLWIHGDSHHYKTDQPFDNAKGQVIRNLWRLEVFGEPRIHAVKVRIGNSGEPAFSFEPIWNPLSLDPDVTRHGHSD